MSPVPTPTMPGAGYDENTYRGQAMAQLRILKQQLATTGLKMGSRTVEVSKGVVTHCSICFNYEEARVFFVNEQGQLTTTTSTLPTTTITTGTTGGGGGTGSTTSTTSTTTTSGTSDGTTSATTGGTLQDDVFYTSESMVVEGYHQRGYPWFTIAYHPVSGYDVTPVNTPPDYHIAILAPGSAQWSMVFDPAGPPDVPMGYVSGDTIYIKFIITEVQYIEWVYPPDAGYEPRMNYRFAGYNEYHWTHY